MADAPGKAPSESTPLVGRPTVESDNARVPVSFSRGLVITLAMWVLLFIQAANMSMMTTAQSDIAADLDAFSETTWFNSAYMIAMSCVTPLTGSLCQIFTPRVYILFTCVVLSLGLFITAVANRLAVFLLGRALSGYGGGSLMVIATLLSLDLTSNKRRGLFLGLINVGFTTGISSGAVLAGLVSPTYGWRSIFWFQAPLALVLGFVQYVAILSFHDDIEHMRGLSWIQKLSQVDFSGAVTLTISVLLLLTSLSAPTITVTPIILCFVSFACFLGIEAKLASQPIMPMEVLKMRSVMLTCLASLILMIGRWSALFFTPVYAIVVRDWSPATAGLILIPTNVGFGLGGLLVGWVHIRNSGSYYISNLVVLLLSALATFVLAMLSTPDSSTVSYVAATLVCGLLVGAIMNYSISHLLHITSPRTHYVVSAMLSMSRGLAGSFGSSMGGGFFLRVLKRGLEDGFARYDMFDKQELIRKLLGSPALARSLKGVERAVAVESYEHAVKTLLLGGCVLFLIATVAQAGTGWTPCRENGKSRQEDVEQNEVSI